jgi:MFS family permease
VKAPPSALRTGPFVRYLVLRFAAGTAVTMLRAAIAWEVFALSRSALQLGLIGIVQFAPALGLSLVAGAVADSRDRRRVMLAAESVAAAVAAALCALTASGRASVPLLYGAVFAAAVASAFDGPAQAALLPSLVSRDVFPRAVAAASTNRALAFATGPALCGLVIGGAGIAGAYAVVAALMVVALVAVCGLPAGAPAPREARADAAAIAEGLAYVRSHPVVLGCMTLDMLAVVFGGAAALLPIYATDILHVGARGYGLLAASLDIGAIACSIALTLLPPIVRAGPALLASVAAYGLATIAFGLSRSFPLSVAAYLAVGVADQVSVVLRSTTIQLATPDALRGRVSSINLVFIGASNQLGAAESGLVAALTTPTISVVSGGVASLVVVATIAWLFPELRRYRLLVRDVAGTRGG